MPGILDGLRVIEGSAYVAAPLGGMTLAQLGADVIRFDQIGGGLDRNRWPVTEDGASLFWAGLNKGKRSIQVDLRSDRGQGAADRADRRARRGRGDPADQLPGPRLALLRGPARAPRRPDHGGDHGQPRRQLGGRLHGEPGDRLPLGDRARATSGSRSTTCSRPGTRSPARSPRPACWRPSATAGAPGEGQLVSVALSDVAFAMVGNLGKIAEAQLCRRERQKEGNYLYGAFGRDFLTADGRRVMVVALTPHQWKALVDATGPARRLRAGRAADGRRPLEGGRSVRRPRGARGDPEALDDHPHPRGDRRDLRPPRRLLGPVPDLHGAGRRGPPLLDREPDVRAGRAARDRDLPDGRLAAPLLRARAPARRPARRCSASTPTRSSPSCSR